MYIVSISRFECRLNEHLLDISSHTVSALHIKSSSLETRALVSVLLLLMSGVQKDVGICFHFRDVNLTIKVYILFPPSILPVFDIFFIFF